MAGGGGDGDGRGGEGVDVVGVVGGGVGGGGAASAATAAAGWRRGASARDRIPAAGGAKPLPRARHEESNLEPRQLGAAGVDHHRGRSAQPPCQAAIPWAAGASYGRAGSPEKGVGVGVGVRKVCLPARRSTDLGTRRRGR